MDNRIIDALAAIRDTYGDGVFYNHAKTKNLLNDLSPELRKERIQITNFLEMNGYFQLKYAGNSYMIIRNRLVKNYVSTYAVGEPVAMWVVDVFSTLLGYNEIKTGAQYTQAAKYAPSTLTQDTADILLPPEKIIPVVVPQMVRPYKDDMAALLELNPQNTTKIDYATRISADFHSAAVIKDGRVFASGLNDDGQCNTLAWWDMTAVSAGTYFTVGLRKDGTVTAIGKNDYGQCNVRGWTDIKEISAGVRHTVGLRADGSVVAVGQNKNGECDVHNWRNIIHVIAGYQCTFGIKKDRRVLVKGNNKSGDLTVSHLNGVKDIANAAPGRAVALLNNGTVVRIGNEDYMQRDFSKWQDICQISAAPDYIAGLRSDGRVKLLAYFWTDTGVECGAEDWRDIIAIAAGRYHMLGLRRDGTIESVMMHPDFSHNKGQCSVNGWHVR